MQTRPIFDLARALVLGVCGTLVACQAEPTIDASSDSALEESAQEVRQSLDPERREKFDEALTLLAFSSIDIEALFSGDASATAAGAKGNMKTRLDGKTADEVIAEAEQIRAKRREKERRQALAEIEELVAKREAGKEAEKALKQFEVQRSRFYIRERSFRNQPIIELTVQNNTEHAISRAFFHGVVASPDRAVPWIEEDFNYTIRGGLEPGEKATWELAPNSFSGWGTEVPEDAVLTVSVEKLNGPDGETLFDTGVFGEREKRRLKALRDEYGTQ